MKRVAVVLVVVGIVAGLASMAQAQSPAVLANVAVAAVSGHHHHPPVPGYAWYGPPVPPRPVVVVPAPTVVVPPPPPVYVAPPQPCYRYYRPYSGIYYQNRGVSIGIGF